MSTTAIVFAVLFVISEGLAEIPQVQSNSTYQLVRVLIRSLKDSIKSLGK